MTLLLLSLAFPVAWAQTTITFKTRAVPEFEQAQTWEYVTSEYAAVHPDRRAVIDVIPFGTDFTTMLTTEFRSGNPADIIVSDRTRASNVDAVEGTILRLDELFDRPNPNTGRGWGEGIYLGVLEANRSLRDGSYNTFQIMTGASGSSPTTATCSSASIWCRPRPGSRSSTCPRRWLLHQQIYDYAVPG